MNRLLTVISALFLITLACGGASRQAAQPTLPAAPTVTPLPAPVTVTPLPVYAPAIRQSFTVAGFTFSGNSGATADAMASVVIGQPSVLTITIPRPPSKEQAQRTLFYIAAMCSAVKTDWPDCGQWTTANLSNGGNYQSESIAAALNINEGDGSTTVTFSVLHK